MQYQRFAGAACLAAILAFVGDWPSFEISSASAQTEEDSQGVDFSTISGDTEAPRRHVRVRNAAELSIEDARAAYESLSEALAEAYGPSGDAVAEAYRGWKIYNIAPYRSATHGQRFVNNYANETAAAYGRYEEAGTLPAGSVIAKDSITVTTSGIVEPGPLFLMEKMEEGFNYSSGDWRYTLISAEGQIVGTTNGEGSAKVGYCVPCHLARESFDHLYFLPKSYRVAE